ncbi:MAG: FimV/HubP family polar landmark protein [Thiolinea sp.]
MPNLRVSILTSLILLAAQPLARAALPPVEIQPTNTLSGIVQQYYPQFDANERFVIMAIILENNPDAFIEQNINRLIVGKTLRLPSPEELPEVLTPAPPPAAQATENASDTELAATRQQLEAIRSERDQLNESLTRLETENNQLKASLTALEQQNRTQTQQLSELEQQIRTLEATAATTAATTAQTDETLAAANAEANTRIEQLNQEKTGLQQQLGEQRDSNTRLQSDNEQLKTALQALQTERTQQANNQQQALDTLQTERDTLASAREQLQQQLNTLQTQQAQTDTTATSALQQQLVDLQQTNTELQTQLATTRQQLEAGTQESDRLKTQLAELETRNQNLQTGLDQLTGEQTGLQGNLDDLTRQNTALETELQQIRAATATDVDLENSTANNVHTLWPWLLALLLLPIAWLLGRRSRPEPEPVLATASPAPTVSKPPAGQHDPVVPAPLPSEALDAGEELPPLIPDNPDTAIKLDMARAYLDLRDAEAANDVLQEVIQEGGTQQQREAREILSFIS